MNKILLAGLMAVLSVSLAACGGGGGGTPSDSSPSKSTQGGSEPPSEPTPTPTPNPTPEPTPTPTPNPPPGPKTVELRGKVYAEGLSLDGARLSLEKMVFNSGTSPTGEATQYLAVDLKGDNAPVVSNASFSLTVLPDAIEEQNLYRIELRCPDTVTEACSLHVPIHAVVDGVTLKNSENWGVGYFSEYAYQRARYYLAAGFAQESVLNELNASTQQIVSNAYIPTAESLYVSLLTTGPSVAGKGILKSDSRYLSFAEKIRHAFNVSDYMGFTSELTDIHVLNLDFHNFTSSAIVREGYAYLIGSDGFRIVDARDIGNASQVSFIHTSTLPDGNQENFGRIELLGNNALISTATYIKILDVSDVNNPRESTPLNVECTLSSFATKGNYLFAGCREGLKIFDITRLQSPVLISQLKDVEIYGSIYLHQDLMLIANANQGLAIYNIGDVSKLTPLSTVKIIAASVTVKDDVAMVAGENGLSLVDIKNPDSPVLLDKHINLSRTSKILWDGTFAYLSGIEDIYAIDISNVTDPRIFSITTIDGTSNPYDIFKYDGKLFVAAGFGGLTIVDASTENFPSELSALSTPANALSLAGIDGNLFVGYGHVFDSGVQKISIDSRHDMLVQETYKEPTWGAECGKFWFNSNSLYWFTEIVSDVFSIDQPQQLSLGGNGNSVFYSCRATFSMTGSTLNIINPEYNQIVTNISYSEESQSFNYQHVFFDTNFAGGEATSSTAYLTTDAGLNIYDLKSTDSGFPALMGQYVDTEKFAYLALNDKKAYTLGEHGSLAIIDVLNRRHPALLSKIKVGCASCRVSIINGFAYVYGYDNGTMVIDVRDPAMPQYIGFARTFGKVNSMQQIGSAIYMASDFGIEVLPLLN